VECNHDDDDGDDDDVEQAKEGALSLVEAGRK